MSLKTVITMLTRNQKDYIQARISYVQSQLEKLKSQITTSQNDLNELRQILINELDKGKKL